MKSGFALKHIWVALILFAVIAPAIMVMYWFGNHLYDNQLSHVLKIEQKANESLRDQIEFEVKRLKTLLINKSDPLSFLLDRKDDPQALREINGLIKNVVEREPAINGVIIISRHADVIAVVETELNLKGNKLLSAEALNEAGIHWGFDKSKEYPEVVIPSLGRTYIGSPKIHAGRFVFKIAVPIGQPVKAILIAELEVEKLWPADAYEEHGIKTEQMRDYILDRRGSLVTTIQDSDYQPGDIMTHLAITRTALINEEWSTDTSYIGATNEPVYGTITTIPTLNWTLVSEVIVSEVTRPIREQLVKLFLLTLFGLFLFIGFTLYLTRKTINPILQISDAVDQVAKGNYQFDLKPSAIRELDNLVTGFNNMAKARSHAENLLREREETLRSSETWLAEAQRVAHVGSWNLNLTTGKAKWSEEQYRLFGYEPNSFEPVPEDFLARLHDEDKERVMQALDRPFQGGNQDYHAEFRIVLPDKQERVVSERGRLVYDKQGKPQYYIGTTFDITEFKHIEETLRRSQKMEVIGQLTGGIAHDFNNILGIILGNLSFLKRQLAGDDKALKRVNNADKAAQRAADLTRQLLGSSSKQAQKNLPTNINRVIKNMDSLISRSITPEVEVEHSLIDDLWLTEIDSDDFESALLNMVINARDAMPKGGKLIIETSNKVLDAAYAERNPNVVPGEYVELAVSDTGIGIPKENMDRVFEPFFTTKTQDKGTGLGMGMVLGFSLRSKGHIKIYSEPGIGTTIRCFLPRSDSVTEEQNTAVIEVGILPRGNETILVVDDDEDLLELAQQYLKELGYTTVPASSGQQALKLLAERPSIDLLFSDVVMPDGMNGYELAEEAVTILPEIRILLTSGYTSTSIIKNGQARFKANLLSKPYSQDTLAKRIRLMLDE